MASALAATQKHASKSVASWIPVWALTPPPPTSCAPGLGSPPSTGVTLAYHDSSHRMRVAPHNRTKATAVMRVICLSPARRANTQKSALTSAQETAPNSKNW
jgi:hypothetical protein